MKNKINLDNPHQNCSEHVNDIQLRTLALL